jgi:3-methyl-2-oxobutanoate hydroxymethyltransferase
VKVYESIGERATKAIQQYVRDVKEGTFPVEGDHTYPINPEELAKFEELVEERRSQEAAEMA